MCFFCIKAEDSIPGHSHLVTPFRRSASRPCCESVSSHPLKWIASNATALERVDAQDAQDARVESTGNGLK